MKVGVVTFDMSPPPGVELAGYPHYPRHNTGVHDPLIASCIYLASGGEELALVTLDILFFSKKYVAQVRRAVGQVVPALKLFLCCSHTHSGPWASGRLDMEALTGGADVDQAYVRFLVDGIARIVLEARDGAFEGTVGVGFGHCGAERGVGGNRRARGGVADPAVGVLAVKDEGGQLRGLLCHYALHPTFIHEDSTQVTADYPAYIRAAVRAKYPDAVFGFAQGASGDQSSRYFRQGQSYGEAERVGGELGRAALEALGSIRFDGSPVIKTASAEVEFALREYAPAAMLRKQAEERIREYEALKAAGASYLDVQNANLRMLGAEDILGYAVMLEEGADIPLLRDEAPAEVTAIRLGGAYLVGLPGECFLGYALDIKEAMPGEKLMVITIANGCLPGYCYTEEALREGGYEVDTSMLAPEFGERMTAAAIGLLERVRGD